MRAFDYDCSQIVEPENVITAVGCNDDGKGNCSPLTTAITGPCGALVDAQTCDGSCTLASAPVVQPCR